MVLFMKNEEKSTSHIFKVTITSEELAILKEYAELQGRPVAGAFMDFVRESKTFEVLSKVNSAGRKIKELKSLFKSKNDEFSSSLT